MPYNQSGWKKLTLKPPVVEILIFTENKHRCFKLTATLTYVCKKNWTKEKDKRLSYNGCGFNGCTFITLLDMTRKNIVEKKYVDIPPLPRIGLYEKKRPVFYAL